MENWEEVLSSIPRGSVCGPIVFVILDLPDDIDSQVKIFTDDTKLFNAIHSEEDSTAAEEFEQFMWLVRQVA